MFFATLGNEGLAIGQFVLQAFIRAWPFILLSIPLSVAVNVSGAGAQIRNVLGRRPVISILMATAFGAISPLCSCTVIPVIFSLLTAGVPLAPVMSFWIASPSMDPEIFLLSVTTLGWNLAIWRLAATFLLSLGAGFLTLYLGHRGFFDGGILKTQAASTQLSLRDLFRRGFHKLFHRKASAKQVAGNDLSILSVSQNPEQGGLSLQSNIGPAGASVTAPVTFSPALTSSPGSPGVLSTADSTGFAGSPALPEGKSCSCSAVPIEKEQDRPVLLHRILKQSGKSLTFVLKFMLIAYIIEALIVLYVPASWIESTLGRNEPLSVIGATLFGLPFYTTNLAALGLLGGLMEKGMFASAALAFLISGPTTTLPAMSAVFGISRPRVFGVYLGIAFGGAILFGMIFSLV